MMNSFTQKIISFFLVTLMLAFTVGVSVYEHYCGCSNQKIASVFLEVTCADKQGETCCSSTSTAVKSCCSDHTQNTCGHEQACEGDDCCKTNIEIIQIDSEYQVSQEKNSAPNLTALLAIIVSETIPDIESKSFAESFYADPSPPIYGRQFLTAVHQLKLDLPVC